MNARFRIGRTYKFTITPKGKECSIYIYEGNLRYLCFSFDVKTYDFALTSFFKGQACPRTWIEKGYVTYQEVA